MEVSDRAGARVARVDVNDGGAALLGLHHPAESNRVALGEVRAFDDDAVRVLQILLKGGGATAAERDPQTGDRGRVSYSRLILDLHDTEAREQLLDEVVLFVVEGGAAEMGDA